MQHEGGSREIITRYKRLVIEDDVETERERVCPTVAGIDNFSYSLTHVAWSSYPKSALSMALGYELKKQDRNLTFLLNFSSESKSLSSTTEFKLL